MNILNVNFLLSSPRNFSALPAATSQMVSFFRVGVRSQTKGFPRQMVPSKPS